MTNIRPGSAQELCNVVADAIGNAGQLEIIGGGTKQSAGADRKGVLKLDMSRFSGVVDYSPSELVLTVAAGTPLAEVEELLASHAQHLAFEPFETGMLYGNRSGSSTIGGVIAAGVCGPRRFVSGGARDHLLGFSAVSGRGELIVAGGKVVKNVTGYDLPKLVAGSWGRLAAITTLTLKVLPRPEENVTAIYDGLSLEHALALMECTMGSRAEVSAAAYLPGALLRTQPSITALRLEGFAASMMARRTMLQDRLSEFGHPELLERPETTEFWNNIRGAAPVEHSRALWRVHLPPAACRHFVDKILSLEADWFCDWGGGLVWLGLDQPEDGLVRQTASALGGHATFIRGDNAMRSRIPMFQPQPSALAALQERVRRAFDPKNVFEVNRFLDIPCAD